VARRFARPALGWLG